MSNSIQAPLNTFRHIAPDLRVYGGLGCLDHLSAELRRVKSSKAMVVTGPTFVEDGTLEGIRSLLGPLYAGAFSDVLPNSPLSSVMDAAAEIERLGADALIALGGGSAMVTARAANIAAAEQSSPRQLCSSVDASGRFHSPRLSAPKLPQFAIPTTPATAAIKAGSAVSDPSSRERLALFDPKTRARAVFLEPRLFNASPDRLFVSASLGTLTFAMEGLISSVQDPLADALLIHSVRQSVNCLLRQDYRVGSAGRQDLMAAALMGGLGTDQTGAGATLPLSHALQALCGAPGGVVDAVLFPHVLRFNHEAIGRGLPKLAEALRLSPDQVTIEALVGRLESLFNSLKMPSRLRELDVAEDTLMRVARLAFDDWYVRSNPREIGDHHVLFEILHAAW